ncbi:MAG: tetratricopeptide repeat protein [Bryobacteraceae bacterium]
MILRLTRSTFWRRSGRVLALLACGLAARAERLYEVTGRLTPETPGAVTLHHVQSPFATDTLADAGGRFRFRRIPAGAYTLSAFSPSAGEGRMTIDVGAGTADSKGRLAVTLRLTESRHTIEKSSRVSARELSIPSKAWKEYLAAQKKLARNDVDGAIADLERAVGIAPRFAVAWNNLGTIAYQTRRYPDAEEKFRRALEADPQAYEPLVNLGGVLINLGKIDEAWKYNVYAVLTRDRDALAHSQLGQTYFLQNKLDLAEKHLLESCRLDAAHFSHPQLFLAEIYLRRGDRLKAAVQLDEFLKHHPDWPAATRMKSKIEEWRR